MTVIVALLVASVTWSLSRGLLLTRAGGVAGTVPTTSPSSGGRPKRVTFQVWLSQAGAAVTPGQFVAVSVGFGVGAFTILTLIARAPAICVLPAVAAAGIPYAYWASARRKQASARSAAWPDAVRYLVGVLGSGIATLHDGLEELAHAGPMALRPSLARYVRLSSRLGDRRALEVLRSELADPVSDPVLLAFEGAVDEGTETVLRVLADLGTQITSDLQLAEKVRTLQTQSRIGNWGCFALPYGVLFLLCITNSSYRTFFSSSIGYLVVAVGVLCSGCGLLISLRLVRPVATTGRVFVTDELA